MLKYDSAVVGSYSLCKTWKADSILSPFYDGSGKVDVSYAESSMFCLYDDDVSVVDLRSGHHSSSQSIKSEGQEDEEPVVCFCLHPSKDEIVLATRKGLLHHVDLTTRQRYRTVKAHQMPILAMCYDPTGTLVATGAADRSIRVWDILGGFCTHSFRDHTEIIRTLRFHPDPTKLLLVSCADDASVRVFDLKTQKCVSTYRNHSSLPTSVAFSEDGGLMASSGRDKVLNFYELRKHSHLRTVPIMEELEGVVFLNQKHSQQLLAHTDLDLSQQMSAHVVVAAGEAGTLKLFVVGMKSRDLESFFIHPLLHFPLSVTSRQRASQDAASLPTAADGHVSQGIAHLHYLPATGQVLSVTKDSNFYFYCIDALVQHMDLLRSKKAVSEPPSIGPVLPSKLLVGSHGDVLDMVVLPLVGQSIRAFQLALITNSVQVRVVDQDFNCWVLDGHRDIVLSIDASPDGKWLVTSSKDHRCLVWSVADRVCIAVAEGHTDSVGSVVLSRSRASYTSRAAFFVSGGADKILKRWQLPVHSFDHPDYCMKLTCTHSVRAHEKDINSVAVSPNDSMVASASQDKTIRLWGATSLSPLATLTGHKRGVWKVVFSPIDKVLVSCSGDRTMKLWSVVDYSQLRTFEGHTASVLSAQFVNKGTQLLSSSADGLIRLWTLRSGECESTMDMHEDRVWALEYLPVESTEAGDGSEVGQSRQQQHEHVFFSGGSDSRVIVWRDVTEEEELQRLAAVEEDLLLEQQLQNDLRNRRFDSALNVALNLGHSLKVLNILTVILEEERGAPDDSREEGDLFSADWSLRLDSYVSALSDEQVDKLLRYLKDWVSNSRHCYSSQVLMNSLLRVVKVDRLVKHPGLKESLDALISYSERHFQRLDRLQQATYMLEYFTSQISLLPPPIADLSSASTRSIDSSPYSVVAGHRIEAPVLFKPTTTVAKVDIGQKSSMRAVDSLRDNSSVPLKKRKAR